MGLELSQVLSRKIQSISKFCGGMGVGLEGTKVRQS